MDVERKKKANGWEVLPHTLGAPAPAKGEEGHPSLAFDSYGFLAAKAIAFVGLLEN